LFRRYGLSAAGHRLRVGILGDSFAAVTMAQAKPWPELLPDLFETQLGRGQVDYLNLAADGQSPGDGLAVAKPLLGDRPADLLLLAYGHDAARAGQAVTDFRNAFQGLLAGLADTPALVVVVTPPPLLQETEAAHSVLPYAQAEEQVARQYGLPVVRGAAVIAASPDPLGCYTGSDLTPAGQALVAQAVKRLLWGADSPSP
jgi:hypothetical protein